MSTNQGRKYVGGKPVKAIQEKPLGKYEQSSEDKAESVWWAEKYGYGVGKMMPVNFGERMIFSRNPRCSSVRETYM